MWNRRAYERGLRDMAQSIASGIRQTVRTTGFRGMDAASAALLIAEEIEDIPQCTVLFNPAHRVGKAP